MTTQKISLIAFLAVTLLGFAQTSLSYKLNFTNETGVPMNVQIKYLPPCRTDGSGYSASFTLPANAPYIIHSGLCSISQVLAQINPDYQLAHQHDPHFHLFQPYGFGGPPIIGHRGDTNFVIDQDTITIQKKAKETKAQKQAAKQAKQEKKAAKKAAKKNKK